MANPNETGAMRRALVLAASVDLADDPNPRVGAVVLDASGSVVGEGCHRGAGTPHAEVVALAAAGARATGGTVVVTLEPCDHQGRTGPCTQVIVAAGVRRVVYAETDHNPDAAGGAATLRAAGIDVEPGVLASDAEALNARPRPAVTWKLAATLDGRSAAADGSSAWITGPEARADVQRLRATCDTVLVGTGTVLADDPRLTLRDDLDRPLPPSRQPLRAVMGLRDLPNGLRVLDDTAPTAVLRTREPIDALALLAGRGCQHVWLEGGPRLAAAFVRAGLVDEVVAYVAPALLGSGTAAVADLGVGSIHEILRLDLVDVTQIGGDVRLTMKRQPQTKGHH